MPGTRTMTSTLILLALAGCGPAPTADAGTTNPAPPVAARQDGGSQKQDPPKQDPPKQQHRRVEQRSFQLDELKTVDIKFGEHVFHSWVMDTHAKRQEGMMFLQDGDFAKDEAMIFVFPQPQQLSFWMKNTLVPLDIAYCDPQGRVLNTYTMRAFDTVSDYSSAGPAMFAIEFKAGTFKEIGVQAGKRFDIPEEVVAKD